MSPPLQLHITTGLIAVLIILAASLGGWEAALGVGFFGALAVLGLLHNWRHGEEEQARTSEIGRQERRRLEAILSVSASGILAVDSDCRLTLMNQAAHDLVGTEGRRVNGLPLGEVLPSPKVEELARQTLTRGQEYFGEVHYGTKVVRVRSVPLESPPGAVLTLDDMTEMRRLESMRTDFVANVSHELKTPLTSIRAYVDTLLDGGLGDTKHNRRFVEKIDTHVDRLAVLITDLLTLSRLESGQAVTQHARVNILDPLLETVARLEQGAEGRDVELSVNVPDQALEVVGDREALQQVFDNLIDNAIKYTESGGHVNVTAQLRGRDVCVWVKDTGTGIPQEDLPRIFERFYRVDKARSRALGGTGLGLSIVKHYVQALDGEVLVDSEVGKGTTFTLRLPRA